MPRPYIRLAEFVPTLTVSLEHLSHSKFEENNAFNPHRRSHPIHNELSSICTGCPPGASYRHPRPCRSQNLRRRCRRQDQALLGYASPGTMIVSQFAGLEHIYFRLNGPIANFVLVNSCRTSSSPPTCTFRSSADTATFPLPRL